MLRSKVYRQRQTMSAIQRNGKINRDCFSENGYLHCCQHGDSKIFQDFAAPDDIYPYSIDEGFIDLTSSLNYFVPDKSISRKDKLDIISAAIQKKIWRKTGIYSTVGMSNSNPLLAKLALDNEAKKTPT